MKANQNIALVGDKVLLVPYRKQHVAKYHEWMLDPELRELTASEPLSLEEEFEMQRKWQEDEDKLTFIILARDAQEAGTAGRLLTLSDLATVAQKSIYDTSLMIGDINLFFKGSTSDEDFEVEAEIMIAEKTYRRNGFGTEALQLLLSFATSFHSNPSSFGKTSSSDDHTLPIPASKVVARIGAKNSASLALFTKLGFIVTKRVEVFDEVELRLAVIDGGFDKCIEAWAKGSVVLLDDEPEMEAT